MPVAAVAALLLEALVAATQSSPATPRADHLVRNCHGNLVRNCTHDLPAAAKRRSLHRFPC